MRSLKATPVEIAHNAESLALPRSEASFVTRVACLCAQVSAVPPTAGVPLDSVIWLVLLRSVLLLRCRNPAAKISDMYRIVRAECKQKLLLVEKVLHLNRRLTMRNLGL